MARTTPAFPVAPVTVHGMMALGVAGAALAASLFALGYIRHSGRLADDVEVAYAITEAFQRRAIDCIDLARAWIGDPEGLARASMSLDISRGLTLCLVKARDDTRLDVGQLSDCVREVEIVNTIFETVPSGAVLPRPVC